MKMSWTRLRQGSIFLTLAWAIAGMSALASPAMCWGQFGGIDDVKPASMARDWSSLPVKSAHSERIEQEILAALNRTISLTLKQSRLDATVNEVALMAGIQIQIDYKALNDANVASDTPISVNVENATARSTLDVVLRPLDLKWIIQNDMATITTKDVADDLTEVRVYPVRDLVVYGQGLNPDFNSLMDLIQNTIKPDSWNSTGGPGAMERFSKNYSLVVSQTREVHEQIELLLAQLRRVSDRHGVWGLSDQRGRGRPADRPVGAAGFPSQSRVYTRVSTDGLVRVHQ